MRSDIGAFCVRLASLSLSSTEKALAVLWFADDQQNGSSFTAGELSRMLRDAGLGEPHSTKLGQALQKSGFVLKAGTAFRIKPAARVEVAGWLKPIVKKPKLELDHAAGYLPLDVWSGTITYIGKLAKQLNACYEIEAYDAAAVLVRRIIETLLIEAYEAKGIENQVKDPTTGDYMMLNGILKDAIDRGSLSLNRDSKNTLRALKEAGDKSAHNRRYIAVRRDLDQIQTGMRVAVDDLLHLAGQK